MIRFIHIESEQAMLDLGACLARVVRVPAVVYLEGDLGAGKTTLTRGFLRELGHRGPVKSPTYTLVEAYEPSGVRVFHFDLYRLAEPEELEFIGVRDYFGDAVCLVEWPQRGQGILPPADLRVHISVAKGAREVTLSADTPVGKAVIAALNGAGCSGL